MAEDSYLGIDIGTSTIEIAYKGFGTKNIENFTFSTGKAFPTYYATEHTKDKEHFGQQAKGKLGNDNCSVVYEMKRILGKSMKHPEVLKLVKKFGFELVKLDNNSLGIKMKHNNEEEVLTPIDIYTRIFKTILAEVDQTIHTTKAVICVPGSFGNGERKMMENMFKQQLGFTDIEIINESTAAALDYFNENRQSGNYAVFDYGGGTLDISVLHFTEEDNDLKCEVLEHGGSAWNGGANIDSLLADYLAEKLGEDNLDDDCDVEDYFKTNEKGKALMKKTVEMVKIELSGKEEHHIELKARISGKQRKYEYDLKREEFNEVCKDLFEEAIEILRSTIEKSGQQIQGVIMVGGTSVIPYLKPRIEEVCKVPAILSSEPSLAVSRGAVVKGSYLSMKKDLTQERSSYSVSFVTESSESGLPVFKEMIKKNQTLPCRGEGQFTVGYGDSIVLEFYQDVEGIYEPKKKVYSMAKDKVPLPQGIKEGDKVNVKMVMNEKGKLDMEFIFVLANGTEITKPKSVELKGLYE